MHELSIAQRIVEIALGAASANGGGRISALRICLGALSCVEPETLRFAIDVAARDTLAEGCGVEFVRVACRLGCRECGGEAERDPLDPCPCCGAPGGDLLAGRELSLDSIEIDDESEKMTPPADDAASRGQPSARPQNGSPARARANQE